jgi:polyphosphate kinase
MVVRGICAIRPGVPGMSETIRVRSVLGRFLEHSRIFHFEGGGEPVCLIGSADMMHRNLDRRVESLVRILDEGHAEWLRGLVEQGASEETSSWHLEADGSWTRHNVNAEGEPLVDAQQALIDKANRQHRKARRRR